MSALSNNLGPLGDQWSTPAWLFKACNDAWGPFDLDAAASAENKKCRDWLGVEHDAITTSWQGHKRVWINPPYSKPNKPRFMARAEQAVLNREVELVCLLMPADTDKPWFQRALWHASEIRFIAGRVSFVPPAGVKPSTPSGASVIIAFRLGSSQAPLITPWDVPGRP